MAHMYNGILLSHKKEWNHAICSNMNGPRDNHTKWGKPDKDKISYGISYMWNLGGKKNTTTYIQNINRPTDTENKLMITEGERWEGGGKLKFGD